MQHLRIVGVHDEENVPQLILSDESGREFALPLDEALRQAVARPPVRPYQAAASGSSPLTPREIQARLRAGATVDQVVSASGLTSAHVERYAGPVHAERAYIAQRARATQVAPASAAEAHRLAFGDEPASLEAMVAVRLRAMDVDLDTLSWDSWRGEDGLWHVLCVFDVDSSETHGAGIGLKPPAEWTFQPVTRHLRAVNRWAESLSALSAPVPTSRRQDADPQTSATGRRLSAVDSVFDVEDASDPRGLGARPTKTPVKSPGATRRPAEPHSRGGRTAMPAAGPAPAGSSPSGGSPRGGSPSRADAAPRKEGQEHEDLLDVLRARRGQRLGADAEADDRLALMLNRQDPQDGGGPLPTQDRATESTEQDDDEHATMPLPRLRPVTSPAASEGVEGAGANADSESEAAAASAEAADIQVAEESGSSESSASSSEPQDGEPSTETPAAGESETEAAAQPSTSHDGRLDAWGFAYEGESEEHAPTPSPTPTDEEPAPSAPEVPAEKPRKRAPARRASMPKWDDILFGSKED